MNKKRISIWKKKNKAMHIKNCGYLLKQSDVIGIGELWKEIDRDQVNYMLYGRIRYRFDLLLQHYKLEIITPWYEMKGVSEESVNANKYVLQIFENEYRDLKELVERKIV